MISFHIDQINHIFILTYNITSNHIFFNSMVNFASYNYVISERQKDSKTARQKDKKKEKNQKWFKHLDFLTPVSSHLHGHPFWGMKQQE
jgi:hypothetical protein